MMWEVWASCLELQKWRGTEKENGGEEQIQGIGESSNTIWSQGDEKARSGKEHGEMFCVWREGAQEVGVSQEE